jgi:5-methylcytosine-specific restriction endonuclease McrA
LTTSRTGTAKYKRNSQRVKAAAKAAGVTHCPGYETSDGTRQVCGVELDYQTPLLPNSVEADHVVPHSAGGSDDLANLRVICRNCNTKRNRVTATPKPDVAQFPTIFVW